MKILARVKQAMPVHVFPGDTVAVVYSDGVSPQRTLASASVSSSGVYDEAIVFESDAALNDELGIEGGIGGMVAKAKS